MGCNSNDHNYIATICTSIVHKSVSEGTGGYCRIPVSDTYEEIMLHCTKCGKVIKNKGE